MSTFPVHEEGPKIARQRSRALIGAPAGLLEAIWSDIPAPRPARAAKRSTTDKGCFVVLGRGPATPVSIKPGRNPISQSQTRRLFTSPAHQGPIER